MIVRFRLSVVLQVSDRHHHSLIANRNAICVGAADFFSASMRLWALTTKQMASKARSVSTRTDRSSNGSSASNAASDLSTMRQVAQTVTRPRLAAVEAKSPYSAQAF